MMLQINSEFLKECAPPESKTPHRVSDKAFAKPSQGEVWSPNPVACRNPSSLPESRVRSIPLWQAQIID